MKFSNGTRYPAFAFEAVDAQSQPFHVVVLRKTLDIQPDGSLRVASKQAPLAMTDEFYGELNKSGARCESDLAPYKPWCDVIVVGEAHVPGHRPMRRFEAGVRVSRKGNPIVHKRLSITGPRYWQKSFSGWKLTEPEPIHSLPLRFEYAYGGECRVESSDPASQRIKEKYRLTVEQKAQHPEGLEKAPAAHTCCLSNNVGRGYSEDWYLKAMKMKRLPAPQIESPQDPIQKFGTFYEPQGLGVIGRAWRSRNKLCGTMDEAFVKSGKSLPEDFDFAYWNGAHPDLQVPWLKGDETIDLVNIPIPDLRADRTDSQGNCITRLILPEQAISAEVVSPNDQIAGVPLNVDTLLVNAEQKTVSLTYRLKLPWAPAIQSLRVVQSSLEQNERRMERIEDFNHQLRQHQEASRV